MPSVWATEKTVEEKSEMTPINVYGLSCKNGEPILQSLLIGYKNQQNLNHVDIAREQFDQARREWGRIFDGIVLTFGNNCIVYDFTR
jgi:hypothetical protein